MNEISKIACLFSKIFPIARNLIFEGEIIINPNLELSVWKLKTIMMQYWPILAKPNSIGLYFQMGTFGPPALP